LKTIVPIFVESLALKERTPYYDLQRSTKAGFD
jgi:hypothetical protein